MMKLRKLLYVFAVMFSLSVFGQYPNYDVLRQFSSEDNAYNLTENFYYTFFHKNYVRYEGIALNTKIVQNAAFQAWLAKEKNYADSIDSAYTRREKVEALRLVDRGYITNADLAYIIDRNKLETALENWNKDINKIISYGGTSADRTAWLSRYNCMRQAITVVNDGHEPSGSKHTYYLDVINEIKDWHTRLKVYLMSLVCGRDLRRDYEALHKGDMQVFRRKQILVDCQTSRTIRLEDYARSKFSKKE